MTVQEQSAFNRKFAVVFFTVTALLMLSGRLLGDSSDPLTIWAFISSFAVMIGASVWLQNRTGLGQGIFPRTRLHRKKFLGGQALLPPAEVHEVRLERHLEPSRGEVELSFRVSLMKLEGERVRLFESTDYLQARRRAESYSRDLGRPMYDETLHLTRACEDLDEPFHRALLKEGRKPQVPSKPYGDEVSPQVGNSLSWVSLDLPPDLNWPSVFFPYSLVALSGPGFGYFLLGGSGALIGLGVGLVGSLFTLPDTMRKVLPRRFEIRPDGFELCWLSPQGQVRLRRRFEKERIEGLWVDHAGLVLLYRNQRHRVGFPGLQWADYAKDFAFYLFTAREDPSPPSL